MLYTYKNIFLNGIEGRNWPSDTLVPTPDLVNISIFEICSVNIFMLVTSQTTIVCEKFLGPNKRPQISISYFEHFRKKIQSK